MGLPFHSQGWVLAGSVSNRDRSSGYSQAWRDSADTDRSVAQIFRAEFSEAQQLGTGKAATIRGNVLHEEPAGDSILAPSEDKVKPRRSEVGGAGRASAGRTPSPAPTSAVWRDQGVSGGAILDWHSCPPNGRRLTCRPPCTEHTPTGDRCEAAVNALDKRSGSRRRSSIDPVRAGA